MANERLYQFPSKATPVPADIIYAGDSAAGFNEVNITIAALIGAYPNLLGIGNLTLSANTFIYSNSGATLTAGAFTALAVSLVADSTISAMQGTLGYTATATASLFAGWDANVNLAANNFNAGYATTATAGATTTLTVGSAQQQYFTGSSNQTVTMPVTSTLVLGQVYRVVNLSTGTITVQSSGANTITTVGANSTTRITCILTSGTTAASWSAETPLAGSGIVNSGTINNLAYYAATGSAVSSLATANNGTLVTSNTGVPSILAGPGSAGLTLLSQAAAAPIWSTNKVITKTVRQVFTSTGTYTPTSGMTFADIETIGAGGGGGGAATSGATTAAVGGAGGGGGYARKLVTAATIGASQAVTIGAAGTAGSAGANNGGSGGTTSVGAIVSATGGGGGAGTAAGALGSVAGGAGGAGSSGDFNTTGLPGTSGFSSALLVMGGNGGSSFFGGGAVGISSAVGAGNAGNSYGGGGSGGVTANSTQQAGGAGFAGIVIITEYINV